MPGAALLAAQAALRGGAGYVKLLSLQGAVGPPDLVTDLRPLNEALADERLSALLIGPGLGRDEAARDRLLAVLERRLPTVVDADALHLLDEDALEGVDASRILITPHEGELRALCDTFAVEAQGKVSKARELAETTGMTVLAKGPDTILAATGERVAYFPSASSWLSIAGTGDVLAGIAASRMGTGSDAFDAAGEAWWIHAEAARIAGPALTAHELSLRVSKACAQFL
jgi:hydroxyethylthiazole kinase-like uncharacterized protein yjeF